MENNFSHPLMENNITKEDISVLVEFLETNPRLTQSDNVIKFEKSWSDWLGVKHSVFVNSGSSANLLSMSALKECYGEGGEVIVPPLTWVSDIASVIQTGFTPKFVDINFMNLAMDNDSIIENLNNETRCVFLTHIQGFNGLSDRLLTELSKRNIPLIEDVCESHGAVFKSKKLGSFGLMSNFSFYYAHHMSTIEGGMICTNDDNLYEILRMLRSHGMTRECDNDSYRRNLEEQYPDLNEKFIFTMPSYNVRNNEIGAVLGINQLKRLDENVEKRNINYEIFLDNIDSKIYFTDFDLEGQSNYGLNFFLREPDLKMRDEIEQIMTSHNIEYRRGSAGGGNQLRQPYLKKFLGDSELQNYPNTDHIHHFGWYIGNYPNLERKKIEYICQILNNI